MKFPARAATAVALLAATLTATSANAQSITLASSAPNTGNNKVFVEKFVAALASEAPQMKVELFMDSALGNERELIDLVRIGETTIHLGVIHSAQYYPELDATLVPYLFTDYASVKRFLAGPIGREMEQALAERCNAVFLGTYYQGARWTTSNKPFATPEELRGIKIRMPQIQLWIEIWSGMGATIAPLPSSEVFSALQAGVIDAQENMLSNIMGRRLHEVSRYLIATKHQQSYITVMINKKFWEKLSEKDQAAIRKAVDDASAAADADALKVNEEIVAEIKAAGLELIEPKPEFRETALPIAEKAARSVLREGVFEAAVEATRQ